MQDYLFSPISASGSFGVLYSQALSLLTIQFKDITLLQNNLNMKLVFLRAPSVVHDTLNEGDFSY